ncbi:YciI family protein [Persicobacter diffluens]
MKKYVMALLYAGENQNLSQEEKVRLQKEHLKNIQKLATEGKLVLAGPFMDDKALRGIYIFDVPTIEEAEALTATDPAIQARSLKMELKPWYGSAALLRVNKVHEKIAQKQP